MTDQEMQELCNNYKSCRDLLKADRSLKNQGVWGFIPSKDLTYILNFVKLFEKKILN